MIAMNELPAAGRQINPVFNILKVGLVAVILAVEALAVGLTIAGLPARGRELAGGTTPSGLASSYSLSWEALLATVFFFTAGVILYYRRGDRLAVFLSLALVALGATETGMTDALINPQWSSGGEIWRVPVYALRSLAMASALLLLYVFPDGRFVPGWTRPLAVAWVFLNLAWFFFPTIPFNPNDGPTWRATPALSMIFGVAWFASGILAQVLRYIHAPDPLTRLQTKWTAAGMTCAVIGTALYYGMLADYNTINAMNLGDLYFYLRPPLQAISVSLFPICLGIAVMRFRLWDIQITLNRALLYGTLTIVIAGIYVLVVAGLGRLLEAQGSPWVALLATTLVAVIFQPLREFLQARVNRMVYGARDDPYQAVSNLGQRLEGALNPDDVLPVIVETVAAALKLPYAAIALRQGTGEEFYVAYGTTPKQNEAIVNIPLTYQGQEVGQLRVAPRLGETSLGLPDRRLLGDLARQAGVAVHAVQATAALRQAREKLVSAREEERRRLRRDLHDGLGPRLASQTLTLDVIARQIHSDPKQAERLVQTLSEQTQQAVAEIRDLINGLRPPTLDDLGLSCAIEDLVNQLTVAGEAPGVTVDTDIPMPDLPAALEVATYRIAQEALTNVVKHAQATHCIVRLSLEPSNQEPQYLCLDVTDNGIGIAPDRLAGVGLQSMGERAAEVGGRFILKSLAEGGTHVRAELPIERDGVKLL